MLPNERFLMEHGRPAINYALIAKAIDFYQHYGFTYIEVPWIAPEEYNKLTYPGPFPFSTEFGVLVGSAEQSLVFMAACGKLEPGKPYIAATPCFRKETVDAIHQQSFFKVELFCYGLNISWTMILLAKEYFGNLGLDVEELNVTDQQTDLIAKNIELGSYGWHEINGMKWSYGTGIAEPRTSHVLNL